MSTNHEKHTPRKPKWRRVEPDEPKQPGDMLYRAQWSDTMWTPWDPALQKPTDHLLCFRPFTPAEENAEELLATLKAMLSDYIDNKKLVLMVANSDGPWGGSGMTADDDVNVIAARAAIAKAEGK